MFGKAYSRSVPLNLFIVLAALVYLFMMCLLLFVRDREAGSGYSYNLIPFKTIKAYIIYRHHLPFSIWFKNLFGNIVLFMPIGVFLPLLNRSFAGAFRLAAVTIAMIACAELLQLALRVGSFDIDDIILNTFGALLGLACIRLMLSFHHPPGGRHTHSIKRRGTMQ